MYVKPEKGRERKRRKRDSLVVLALRFFPFVLNYPHQCYELLNILVNLFCISHFCYPTYLVLAKK